MVTNNAANAQNAQYNLLVGTGSAYTNIAPSATSGVPLISQGNAANPAYGTAVVAGGGTGVTSNTAYSVLCGGTTSTNPIQSVASVGTSGQVLTSNGAGALPTFQTPAGSSVLVQSKQSLYTTRLQVNTQIPIDDTIPQNTEGQEVITLSITPTNVNNILVITWNVSYCAFDGVRNYACVCALFQDSIANAKCAVSGGTYYTTATYYGDDCVLRYFMTAGTTSSTTFKIRMGYYAGGAVGGGVVLNGESVNRVFGGVAAGMFQIQELTP